jgi:hypothetical protein
MVKSNMDEAIENALQQVRGRADGGVNSEEVLRITGEILSTFLDEDQKITHPELKELAALASQVANTGIATNLYGTVKEATNPLAEAQVIATIKDKIGADKFEKGREIYEALAVILAEMNGKRKATQTTVLRDLMVIKFALLKNIGMLQRSSDLPIVPRRTKDGGIVELVRNFLATGIIVGKNNMNFDALGHVSFSNKLNTFDYGVMTERGGKYSLLGSYQTNVMSNVQKTTFGMQYDSATKSWIRVNDGGLMKSRSSFGMFGDLLFDGKITSTKDILGGRVICLNKAEEVVAVRPLHELTQKESDMAVEGVPILNWQGQGIKNFLSLKRVSSKPTVKKGETWKDYSVEYTYSIDAKGKYMVIGLEPTLTVLGNMLLTAFDKDPEGITFLIQLDLSDSGPIKPIANVTKTPMHGFLNYLTSRGGKWKVVAVSIFAKIANAIVGGEPIAAVKKSKRDRWDWT